jgi:hypothetical protein
MLCRLGGVESEIQLVGWLPSQRGAGGSLGFASVSPWFFFGESGFSANGQCQAGWFGDKKVKK